MTAMGSQASVRACVFAMSCMRAVCADRGGVRAQKSVGTMINDAGNPGGLMASSAGQSESTSSERPVGSKRDSDGDRRALDTCPWTSPRDCNIPMYALHISAGRGD